MTFFEIPLRHDLPFYKFRINLSGVTYSLEIRYNGRMNRYIMNVNDAQNNQILSGLPVLINRNMTGQYRTLSIPVGTFFSVDDTNQGVQPTQYSFGLTHTMVYGDPTT